MNKVVVTGGAGFIGSKIVSKLFDIGIEVHVIDSLNPQIHGEDYANSPLYNSIKNKCVFHKKDITKIEDWSKYLKDAQTLIHLVAETGTGQSMYEVVRYEKVNSLATANLVEYVVNNETKLEKIVVSSSRAVYGEGKYKCAVDGIVYPKSRNVIDMDNGLFEPRCPHCNSFVERDYTDEFSAIEPNSIYGLTKYTQEKLLLIAGESVGIEVIALRYQNVYGPGQSLSNPYTGILSIFSTRILSGKDINIFEDGLESRDFIFIDDVVDVTLSACSEKVKYHGAINIGSGVITSVLDVVESLKTAYGRDVEFNISGDYRIGDIRHNVANTVLAEKVLDFKPSVNFREGVKMFADWVSGQDITTDLYAQSLNEMREKKLLR